jgi:hypothetical protein
MTTEVGKVGLYLVNGTAGHAGMPGAPILHFSLLVNAVTGVVTGHARQTQAVDGPRSDISIGVTQGEVWPIGFGQYTKVVVLRGEGVVSVPPPGIGTYGLPFSAVFAVDDQWDGQGGWSLGGQINDVPVRHD